MEGPTAAVAPLLLRNLLAYLFILADHFLIYFVKRYRILEILRRLLLSAFVFFLRLLPSLKLYPSARSPTRSSTPADERTSPCAAGFGDGGGSGSGIARALTQLLVIMNDIPVSSRKYEVVRSLAEKLIEGNLSEENNHVLREVNCTVLSAAFERTLSQIEDALVEEGRGSSGDGVGEAATVLTRENHEVYLNNTASRLFRGARHYGRMMWRFAKPRDEMGRTRSSGEKLAAELLWLAQKLSASGCACEAVRKWASASKIASLSMTAEPRLQGSLVKVSAFLIKQAREMGSGEELGRDEVHEIRRTKMKILLSWLPLLCRANNGTDVPIVSSGERAELEKVVEDIIWTLDEEEEEQERVLSVWLHHFAYCSSSDWPNLRSCYSSWLAVSRTTLLHSTHHSHIPADTY